MSRIFVRTRAPQSMPSPQRTLSPFRAAWTLSLALALIVLAAVASISVASGQISAQKTLQGKVLTSGEKALPGAIIYLQDSRTNNIKTFISTADGSYRFGQLSGDSDYTVWAAWKEKKSSTKSISSFDSRKLVTIDLHIKTE